MIPLRVPLRSKTKLQQVCLMTVFLDNKNNHLVLITFKLSRSLNLVQSCSTNQTVKYSSCFQRVYRSQKDTEYDSNPSQTVRRNEICLLPKKGKSLKVGVFCVGVDSQAGSWWLGPALHWPGRLGECSSFTWAWQVTGNHICIDAWGNRQATH